MEANDFARRFRAMEERVGRIDICVSIMTLCVILYVLACLLDLSAALVHGQ